MTHEYVSFLRAYILSYVVSHGERFIDEIIHGLLEPGFFRLRVFDQLCFKRKILFDYPADAAYTDSARCSDSFIHICSSVKKCPPALKMQGSTEL